MITLRARVCVHVCVSVAVFGNFLHTVRFSRYSILQHLLVSPAQFLERPVTFLGSHNKIELKPRKTHNGYLRRHSLNF